MLWHCDISGYQSKELPSKLVGSFDENHVFVFGTVTRQPFGNVQKSVTLESLITFEQINIAKRK
jgi:hypothetical protein